MARVLAFAVSAAALVAPPTQQRRPVTARAVTGRRVCCVGGATRAAAETAKASTRAMFRLGGRMFRLGERCILVWSCTASRSAYESWFFALELCCYWRARDQARECCVIVDAEQRQSSRVHTPINTTSY